ncbi:MAG: hypothetical protein J6D28_01345 [Bacilli bacterium]|nr:hypothetical protein [Bacilli bacterium]
MDFLKEYNLTEEDITIIKNNNYENVINVIIFNKNNVCQIIEYLLSIGIETTTLAQILSDRLDLFMKTKEEISEKFDKFNVENLVTIINDDIANLKFI